MFIAKSDYLKKIKKLADSIKDLHLNVYIWGERGVGKSFLAKYILPNGVVNPKTNQKEVILENNLENISLFKGSIIVATGYEELSSKYKEFFDIEIELKPLKEHLEDVEEFLKFFTNEAKENLKIEKDIVIKNPDISENLNSLKREVYKSFFECNSKKELFENIEKFYIKNPNILYEEEIKSFEKALFKAMKYVYKSKLKISQTIKINRVTLTKKMKELNV